MGYKHKRRRPRGGAGVAARRRTTCSRSSRTSTARARICELVEYYLEDVDAQGRLDRPGRAGAVPHALAPVAELPVLEVISAIHILADLTLGLGKVVHDYLG